MLVYFLGLLAFVLVLTLYMMAMMSIAGRGRAAPKHRRERDQAPVVSSPSVSSQPAADRSSVA